MSVKVGGAADGDSLRFRGWRSVDVERDGEGVASRLTSVWMPVAAIAPKGGGGIRRADKAAGWRYAPLKRLRGGAALGGGVMRGC